MSNEKVVRFSKQHFVVDLRQTLKALEKGQVTSLIITKDVKIYLLAQIFSQINHKSISITYFKSRSTLGKAVGINVNTAIAALLNEN